MGCQTTRTSFTMVVLLAVLLASLFSTVHATIGQRYGGPIRRPVHFFNRPRPLYSFPGTLVPSPTHAYPIFQRPQQLHQQSHNIRFPQPQQYSPPLNHGFVPINRPQPQLQLQQSYQYPVVQPQRPQPPSYQPQRPAQISYQQPHTQISYHQPQPPSTIYGQTASNYYVGQSPSYTGSSSFNQVSYYPQANRPFHFHTKPLYDASGAGNGLSYEPCTQSHWQPVGTSSITPAASSQQPTYFYGGSVSTTSSGSRPAAPAGPTYFRYQPESSNKVVVLSHDVLKSLLANSKAPTIQTTSFQNGQSGTKGMVDSVASASGVSTSTFLTSNHIVQTGASSAAVDALDQPSVKLVGYIGPSSGNTPSGYIQVPISKEMMENLSGSGSNYDFAVNSSSYSLFTLKSVNDVDSLFGMMKSNDNSQTLGLVVSNSANKDQDTLKMSGSSSSDTIFYPVASSSNGVTGDSATVTATNGNPAIQMVGHVQITSPDISTHFVKRQDTPETMTATS